MKFSQIYYRIWFYLWKPNIKKNKTPKIRTFNNKFNLPIKKEISLLDNDKFHFLNKSFSLSKVGWQYTNYSISKLWRYNQHYFDDLNAIDSFKRTQWHYKLIKNWINKNKLAKGIGWDSYPTSLRIVNWIKWQFLGNKLSTESIDSLALQARWLNQRIEWHILGNHLFSNAKALIFSGLFFSGKEAETWLNKGLKIINDELNEQILEDGGNFERSTMYHSIFLEDLLDLINIALSSSKNISNKQVTKWIEVSKKMFQWLEIMVHPDGEIAFFNDSTLGIAPTLKELKMYANRLGVDYSPLKTNKVINLSASGYVRINSNNATALLDVAPLGPSYLLGHAHADTLSFELSLFGQRIFVNTGTSEYEIGSTRQYERSTKAHNSVIINDENSSEVWKGFRVARRANPFDLNINQSENFISISCSHDGYKRLIGKPIHRRTWEFYKSLLIINDNVLGSFKVAFAYFHLHPKIKLSKKQINQWNLNMPNGQKVILEVKKGKSKIIKSYYAPQFGKKIETYSIIVALDKKEGSSIQISW